MISNHGRVISSGMSQLGARQTRLNDRRKRGSSSSNYQVRLENAGAIDEEVKTHVRIAGSEKAKEAETKTGWI